MPYQNIQSIKATAQNAVTPLRSLLISRMANLTCVSSAQLRGGRHVLGDARAPAAGKVADYTDEGEALQTPKSSRAQLLLTARCVPKRVAVRRQDGRRQSQVGALQLA